MCRVEGAAFPPSGRSFARLVVGSLHNDRLLLCRPLVLEQFASPLAVRG